VAANAAIGFPFFFLSHARRSRDVRKLTRKIDAWKRAGLRWWAGPFAFDVKGHTDRPPADGWPYLSSHDDDTRLHGSMLPSLSLSLQWYLRCWVWVFRWQVFATSGQHSELGVVNNSCGAWIGLKQMAPSTVNVARRSRRPGRCAPSGPGRWISRAV